MRLSVTLLTALVASSAALDLSPRAAAKILRSARSLDEYEEEEPRFFANYNLKFVRCDRFMQLPNQDNTQEQGGVLLRLCPSSMCSSDSAFGCDEGYGDFVVSIETFLENYAEYTEDDNLADDSFSIFDHTTCEEYEVDDDANGWAGFRSFVGPTCTDDGNQIKLEFFMDDECKIPSSIPFSEVSNGWNLPYSNGGLVSSICNDCFQSYGAYELCSRLYESSMTKCETKMEYYGFYGRDVSGCEEIREIFHSSGDDSNTTLCQLECQNGGDCRTISVATPSPPIADDDCLCDDAYEETDVDNNGIVTTSVCNCPIGYYGMLCEFQQNMNCTLPCQNGGVCKASLDNQNNHLNNPNYYFNGGQGRNLEDPGEEEEEDYEHFEDEDDDYFFYQHCDCSDTAGFSGRLCEKKECGRGYCESGAVCTKLPSTTSTTRQKQACENIRENCDCENANDDDACEASCYINAGMDDCIDAQEYLEYSCDCSFGYEIGRYMAGRQCQYTISSMCDETSNPNGPVFCVNGGTCLDESMLSCGCPRGYGGPRCEYDMNDYEDLDFVNKCTLSCENGGLCYRGVKPVADIFLRFVDKTEKSALFSYAVTENFDYCWCPEGHFGVRCEHQYELCGRGDHICFHGSKCAKDSDNSWQCNCDGLLAAGLYCQHKATDVCNETSTNDFCTNGGTCSLAENKTCDCLEGFNGTKCEIVLRASDIKNKPKIPRSAGVIGKCLTSFSAIIMLSLSFLI